MTVSKRQCAKCESTNSPLRVLYVINSITEDYMNDANISTMMESKALSEGLRADDYIGDKCRIEFICSIDLSLNPAK